MIPAIAIGAVLLGLNVHQSSTVGPSATKGASLGIVRIDANWQGAETTQGAFDFTLFDQVVNAAQSRGLAVLAVLAYGPAWASTGDKQNDGPNNDVPQAGTYAAYVTAAVNHLKDRVTYYELWNEPNLGQFFEGTPQDYLGSVLIPGADALHAACATCKVVGPAVATIGTNYATFLDAVLAGAKDKIDIVSGHDYAQFPQDTQGAGGASDSFYNKLESHRIVKFGTTTIYEGPLSMREVMNAHAATQPFWITETGIEATYGDTTAEATQTLYYRRVLESMLTRPWWQTTIFYEAFDVPPPAQYHFGVCVDDSAASLGYDEKPVMAMLRKAAQNQPVFGGTGTDCTDGLDNDGDGLIDSADPDCATSTNEGLPPVDAGAPDAGDVETDSGGGGCNAGGDLPSPLLLVLLALFGCSKHESGREGKRTEGHVEEPVEAKEEAVELAVPHKDPRTFAVPIRSCSCTTGGTTYTLHAPKGKRILWWLGVQHDGGKGSFEEQSFMGSKKDVIPPPEGSRMLMGCALDVVVLVREDRAAAWRVPSKDDLVPLWTKKLPQRLDTTGIDAPALEGASLEHAGCGRASMVNDKMDVPLRDGKHVSIDFGDGGS